MPKKKEKVRNANTLSESEYFSKIRSALRKAFTYWKPAQIALKKASRPNQSDNKRLKFEFQCAECKNWFKRDDVHIDHIIECGSLKGYDDIVPFIMRLTTENVEDFQVLCKHHHLEKTKKQRLNAKAGL
jgi:5-methylcytosine-specific restriction endonuclease McrA